MIANSTGIAVDVGGTFTDAVFLAADGRVHVLKVPSTPDRPSRGFEAAIDATAREFGADGAALGYLGHGTTVATNALVQGRAAKVALLVTAGVRDVLEIGTQQRRHPYDPRIPNPAPAVPREHCIEVAERTGPDGEVMLPLTEETVGDVIDQLGTLEIEAVAVCLLFSFLNPTHERRLGDRITAKLGLPVSLSSSVSPKLPEYPRASTTIMNASLLPLMGAYTSDLDRGKRAAGITIPLSLMQSNGGLGTVGFVQEKPVNLIASGPAGGVIGAARLGGLAGVSNLLTFDMGGTTADVGLVINGQAQMRYEGEVHGQPVALPQVEVLSVGAGAGSIATVDEFGSLTVGPRSAGAVPGPAAYDLGGEQATVADAHFVLGSLNSENFLGGRMPVSGELARKAVEENVASQLGLDVYEAAAAILRIADATMAGALRVLSIARGLDPRDLTLAAFGGAGPLHACRLAEELNVRRVLVPRYPGAGSALGILVSDVRYDFAESWVKAVDSLVDGDLAAAFASIEESAMRQMGEAGFVDDGVRINRGLGIRYIGQAYELVVPLPDPLPAGVEDGLAEAFEQAHLRAYGHSTQMPAEIVTLHLRAEGMRSQVDWEDGYKRHGQATGSRAIWIDGQLTDHSVHRRDLMTRGDMARGPAVIEQDDTTVIVPPGWRFEVVEGGSSILEVDR